MTDYVEKRLKYQAMIDIADKGMRIIIGNSSKRAKTQFKHAIFCIFLFLVYLFTNPNPETLGHATPFLMPFLLFSGSLGTLLFYRTILNSDTRGYSYIEKSAKAGNELRHADISRGFFDAIKKRGNLKNLKLENLLYVGFTTFLAGLFAISTVWQVG